MQLHQLKPIHKRKKKKRVGRGGKRGHFSGAGIKGQKSRAGRKMQPVIRELIKRYHKLRGYRKKTLREDVIGVNLDVLNKAFKEGEVVSPRVLTQRRIVRKIGGRIPEIKILGKGKINKKLNIRDCYFSQSARKKIEKAGGSIK